MTITTSERAAFHVPLRRDSLEPPLWYEPPCKKNQTGSDDEAFALAGVKTLRKRQFSESVSNGWRGEKSLSCKQLCWLLVASNIPFHRCTGAGSAQRSDPSGGAAKGRPRKERYELVTIPRTAPSVITTISWRFFMRAAAAAAPR